MTSQWPHPRVCIAAIVHATVLHETLPAARAAQPPLLAGQVPHQVAMNPSQAGRQPTEVRTQMPARERPGNIIFQREWKGLLLPLSELTSLCQALHNFLKKCIGSFCSGDMLNRFCDVLKLERKAAGTARGVSVHPEGI